MACRCEQCTACDARAMRDAQAAYLILQSPFQSGGFRIPEGELRALERKLRAPFVYRDSLGNGGATAPRYAQTEGDQGWSRQLGEIDDGLEDEEPFYPTCIDTRGEHPGQCFNFQTFSCEPCATPGGGPIPGLPWPGGGGPIPGLPGSGGDPLPIPDPGGGLPVPELPGGPVVSEEACRVREERARADARTNVIMIAVASGAASAFAGYLVSRALRR